MICWLNCVYITSTFEIYFIITMIKNKKQNNNKHDKK